MKQTKKILSMLTVAVLVILLAFPTSAAEATASVTLRIEGAEQNLFYGTVDYTDTMTVADAIQMAAADGSFTVVGLENGYITGVNNESAGQVGDLKYDGWMLRVNGKEISVAASDYELQAGDQIVLYYSDTYGVGFQFTQMDPDRISEGILTFTGTAFDWNTMQDVTTPIVGATVTWGYGAGQTATYVTDANGSVTIDAAQITVGDHSVQIEKYDDTILTTGGRLPLVLRLPHDTVVTIQAKKGKDNPVSSSFHQKAASKSEMADQKDDLESPKTGESVAVAAVVLLAVTVGGMLLFLKKEIAE